MVVKNLFIMTSYETTYSKAVLKDGIKEDNWWNCDHKVVNFNLKIVGDIFI
jgi:hypothetical protein